MEIAFPMPSCINPIDDQGNQTYPFLSGMTVRLKSPNSPSPLREAQMCNLQPKELLPKFGICNHLRSHPTALLGNDDLIQHIDFTRVFANSTPTCGLSENWEPPNLLVYHDVTLRIAIHWGIPIPIFRQTQII